MYDMIKIVFALIALGCGIYMVICPKLATKKEMRDDPEVVAKTRKSGIIITVCGILLVVLNVVI